jgi:tetratricopeptide (TPR) repeat protein
MDSPESIINAILEDSPSQETLHLLLRVLKSEGGKNLVIRECRKAALRFPNDLVFKKILAEAYLEEGRVLDAEEEVGRVIEGIRKLAAAYKLQSDIFLLRGRKEDAVLSLKHYLLFHPEDTDAALRLEELGHTAEAVLPEADSSIMDSGIQELEQELPEIITETLAKVYLDQGKLDEARDIYEKLGEANPDDAMAASRLKEVSAIPDEPVEEPRPVNEKRHSTERIMSVLDAWRKNIRELSDSKVTAG